MAMPSSSEQRCLDLARQLKVLIRQGKRSGVFKNYPEIVYLAGECRLARIIASKNESP
jgi:hypothetical protein